MKDTFNIEKLHPLTRVLLEKRGITEAKEVEDFLFPSYEKHIGNPFDIHGMDKAVARIIMAIKNGEKIAVYSDYDCDGIPGGVLLRTFFDDIGYPVEIYVPHRHNEGYGIHNHAIDALKKKGVSLIITVDLAITNIEEVAYAKSVGVDVIVTDHHLPITGTRDKGLGTSEQIQIVPEAVAVINSKQDVCNYHDDMLCGCAVAWKLSCAILSTLRGDKIAQESFHEASSKKQEASVPREVVRRSGEEQITNNEKRITFDGVLDTVSKLKDGHEKWLLDLVGISTISDMVPLVKENRALAHFGLKVLRQTKRHGLNQIFLMQGVSKEHLTEEDIAFTIAPRINAAGRMGDPIQAHNMLYEKNSVIAQGFVEDLEALNMERKQGVKDITEGIDFEQLNLRPGRESADSDVVAVGDLSWGPGVLGLIAQKIIDETGKPTFVWGQGGEVGTRDEGLGTSKIPNTILKGSCRSRGDVHVVELMARVQEMFPGIITHSGGHEQAGGFSCALDRIGELSDALNEAIKHVEKKEIASEKLVPDTELTLDDVNLVTHNAINILAPFGVGNHKPLFSFSNAQPQSVRWFGKKGEHLEVIYPRAKGDVKAIIFFAPKDLEERAKKPHTLLAHIEKSVFRGKTELRLRIREII